MTNIFLIGDSIRLGALGESGYGDLLRKKLKDKANVYQPEDNCRFAAYTLRYLHEWANIVPDRENIDYVFWNNGLWDTLILTGEEEPLTVLDTYINYMERVYKRIKLLFPKAQIVFLTSTCVEHSLEPPESTRSNRQIKEYNDAVCSMLEKYEVPCIDFYSVSRDLKLNVRTDWVHYTSDGAEVFADILYQYVMNKEKEA